MPSFPEGGPAAARVGLGCAAASAAIATAAWLLLPPPKELPDRLAHVPEDAVEINNDEIYATFDWWNVRLHTAGTLEDILFVLSLMLIALYVLPFPLLSPRLRPGIQSASSM